MRIRGVDKKVGVHIATPSNEDRWELQNVTQLHTAAELFSHRTTTPWKRKQFSLFRTRMNE